MRPISPTPALIQESFDKNVTLEAFVINYSWTTAQGHFEPSFFRMLLRAPHNDLLLTANLIVAGHLGVETLTLPKANMEPIQKLERYVRSAAAPTLGVFGGRLAFLNNSAPYPGLSIWLAYADFPKGSGEVYLFDSSANLVSE